MAIADYVVLGGTMSRLVMSNELQYADLRLYVSVPLVSSPFHFNPMLGFRVSIEAAILKDDSKKGLQF